MAVCVPAAYVSVASLPFSVDLFGQAAAKHALRLRIVVS
jgi:hypothetical protein